MSLRQSRRGTLASKRVATAAGTKWMRGASGTGTNDGSFSTWAGYPLEVITTWSDAAAVDQINAWPLAPAGLYGSWTKPVDLAVGGIFKGAGETWAQGAAGAYDSRFTTMWNTIKNYRTGKGTTYVRFAHEFSGSFMTSWSVNASEAANFILTWRRVFNLKQSIFPAAKMVWCPNGGQSTGLDIRNAWPGAAYVDVYGVDYYNSYPATNTLAGFNTKLLEYETSGAPKGIQRHWELAQSYGVPFCIPEWGTNGDAASEAQGTDAPVYIQSLFDWLNTHSTLYECYYNDTSFASNAYGIYPTTKSPLAAAKYQQIWKTLSTVSAPTTSDPVMGVSSSDENHKFTQWDAVRTYKLSGAKTDAANLGARVIALSDDPGVSITGGSASATLVKNFLEDFYYGSGSAARQGIEVHYANGNEVDRDYSTGSLPTAYIDTVRLISQAIKTLNSDGTRRYPLASMWVDMTQNNIRNSGAGPRFKPIAQYLDGVACSMYPPGRQQDPVVFTPYATYCDEVFDMVADWKATYPNVTQFATWEFGIPIDHAVKGMGAGQGTASTNYTIRPRYVGGGIDSAGTDWTGFLQYVYNKCQAIGVQMREQCYWDQQVSADMPNQLFHDFAPLANPDTATAWHNWTPGSRLPNG